MFCTCVASRSAAAQKPRTDSALVRVVMEATLAGIAPELNDIVLRPASNAVWKLTPPDTTDPLWVGAFRGLLSLLHGHEPSSGDEYWNFLTMHEHDSGAMKIFDVTIGWRDACPGLPKRAVAADRFFTVRVVRSRGWWETLPPELPIDGAPGEC